MLGEGGEERREKGGREGEVEKGNIGFVCFLQGKGRIKKKRQGLDHSRSKISSTNAA